MLRRYDLFDVLKKDFNIKTDGDLAKRLRVTCPHVSKVRNRVLGCSDGLILRVHEAFGLPVDAIRAMLVVTNLRDEVGESA